MFNDMESNDICALGVVSAVHTGEGGPCPPTGKSAARTQDASPGTIQGFYRVNQARLQANRIDAGHVRSIADLED